MELLSATLTGIASGIISAALFLTLIRSLKPKILISPQISAYPSTEGKEVLRIKIVNLRHRSISDLSVQVYLEEKRSVHGGEIKVRTAIGSKFTSHTQAGRKYRDRVYDNARRIRLNRDQLVEALALKPNGYVVVEVFGRDAISGVGEIFTQEYALGTDRCIHGSFQLGNSVEILPYNGGSEFRLAKDITFARERLQDISTTPQEKVD